MGLNELMILMIYFIRTENSVLDSGANQKQSKEWEMKYKICKKLRKNERSFVEEDINDKERLKAQRKKMKKNCSKEQPF